MKNNYLSIQEGPSEQPETAYTNGTRDLALVELQEFVMSITKWQFLMTNEKPGRAADTAEGAETTPPDLAPASSNDSGS